METKNTEPTLTVIHRPGKDHPGQTAEHVPTHDRMGSQLENERHQYANGDIPKVGSARTGKRPRIKRGGS